MTLVHRFLGAAVIASFIGLMLWALVLRLQRRDEAPKVFWIAQHYLENVLILQAVGGIVLLVIGRRVTGSGDSFLHYFYGSLFPLVAIVGGRIAGLRREDFDYVGIGWGSFFAFGLTLRAAQTGCQGILDLACLLP